MPDGPDLQRIVEPDQLFNRLFDGLAQEHLPRVGAKRWTAAVRKTLKQFARELDRNIVVYYSNDSSSEFLVDLMWLKPARDDPDANGKILLAVECEWSSSPDNVWYDFSKLLYVRAPRKLLICCLSPKALKEALQQYAQEIVDAGGLESHEKYIVINFGNQRVEYWWCEPSEPVRFQKGSSRQYWQF
jgi:hypothetical protein